MKKKKEGESPKESEANIHKASERERKRTIEALRRALESLERNETGKAWRDFLRALDAFHRLQIFESLECGAVFGSLFLLMRLVNPQNEGQKKALVKVAERVLGREVKG
jgi:hypothetical protein